MKFDSKQKFSIRKYSFGAASVLIGTLLMGAGLIGSSDVHADEFSGSTVSTDNSQATTADLITETPTSTVYVGQNNGVITPQAESTSVLTVQASSEAPSNLTSEAASQVEETAKSEAAQSNQASASSEVAASQAASSQAASQTLQNVETTVSTVASTSSLVASSESPVATTSEVATGSEATAASTVDTQAQPTTMPLSALEEMLPSRSFARLMNSINAAVAERNRGRSGQAGTTGFRISFADSGSALADKLQGLALNWELSKPGVFLDTKYVDRLKVEADADGIIWVYDVKVSSSNPAYLHPQYVAGENHELGYIDFVDSNGNAISGVTARTNFTRPTTQITADGQTFDNLFDAAIAKVPTVPAGYRLKTVNGDPTKVEAYVDIFKATATYNYQDMVVPGNPDAVTVNTLAMRLTEDQWDNKQRQTVTLIQNADGSFSLDPSVDTVGSTLAPGYHYHLILEADETDITKPTSQTVTYTGAATNPPANVDSSFTFQGKKNNTTGAETWDSNTHTYGTVTTPVVTGYYADKATAGGKTVTPDAPDATDTVTYKELGKIILVDEQGNKISNTDTPTYNNDSNDPTKGSSTAIPGIPTGYEIKTGQNIPGFDPSGNTVTPNDPGTDTRIVLVPKSSNLTVPTIQTVKYTSTDGKATVPGDKVQNDFTFTGTENAVTGNKTWNAPDHTYGKEDVPVITGYFADKAEAGGKTVTPDAPTAEDTVTYKPLGKIIPVDPDGNEIPNVPTPQYNNDPKDPTKGGETPVPEIPGYTPRVPNVTPNDPGTDTKVIYEKDDQKAIIKYVNENGNVELAKDEVTGKSGEAINYSTTDKINEFKRKGYELVSDGFTSASDKNYDLDKNVDQEFTVVLRERIEPVDPDNPNPNPTDPVDPSDPNTPQWPDSVRNLDNHDDVTRTIKYVYEDGSTAANDASETLKFKRVAHVNLVTGATTYDAWTSDDTTFDKVTSPTISGYTPDVAEVPEVTGVTAGTADSTVTVTYVKDAQKAVIKYVNENGNVELAKDEVAGKSGEAINYSTTDRINNLKRQGYELVTDGFTSASDKNFDNDANVDQEFTVVLRERIEPVDPDNPNPNPTDPVDPSDPNTPTWPDSVRNLDNHDDVTRTIKYVYEDGSQASADASETLKFKRVARVNLVTGATTYDAWTSDKDSFDAVTSPTISGYTVDKALVPSETGITAGTPDSTVVVTYVKDGQKATVTYVDRTTGATLEVENLAGQSGEAINYSTADKIKYYEDRGYKLVSDDYPTSGATFDNDVTVDQTWTVTLEHDTTPVGPNNPHLPTDPINPNDPDSPKYPSQDQWKKDVTSTVKYVVSDGGATAPTDNVQNAQWTRTITLDKVTGQEISATPWASDKSDYDAVSTPVLDGYYADKATVASKTVTQDNLEETVTYKPLGKLVPKSDDPNFPTTPEVKYPNDPTDPTKPSKPIVPDVPGYKPFLPDPSDPTKPGDPLTPGQEIPNLPNDPGADTPVIYVPIVDDVTQATSQTVKYTSTDGNAIVPADKVQNDYTFTGKKKQVDGTTTWDETSHTYGKETVPVITGYFADKKEAGGLTVTPTAPTAEDTVTYKPLGKIIPVDVNNTPIPGADQPQYNNDPNDPTSGGVTPIPDIPGYVPQTPGQTTVTPPNDPSQDTPVVYVKADQKASIKYVDQTTGTTLETDQLSGKSGEAVGYSTADKIKYYEDRGYKLVSDEFPAGANFDNDATVDQTWTVTLEHDTTPVGPNDPHLPTDPINPNDPNSPKYPAEDQWKKDVTSTVKYVVSDGGATAPTDNVQNAQWTRTITLDKVTGQEISATSWVSDKSDYDEVKTSILDGYYADKATVASKTVTQDNLEETVTYKPLGKLVPKSDDPNFPTTPEVKYPNDPTDPTKPSKPIVPDVPGYRPFLPDPSDPTKPGDPLTPGQEIPNLPNDPGTDTPVIYVPIVDDVTRPTKQTVTFEGAGSNTPATNEQSDFTFEGKYNQADKSTTWNETSHEYGKVNVPVVPGYYADKKEAGGLTVTPDQPEVEDKVVYKELGKIIPVDESGNEIPGADQPQYNNDPNDPTKGGQTPTPVIPGYVTDVPNVTPNDPGVDTPVVYRKADQKAVIVYVDRTTGTTLENDQIGGKSGEAINYSTADKIKYYEDRGYKLVSDEFPAGATFDNDATVDQTWTVTLEHDTTPVGPNDPHLPTDPINPNDPNSPKYPAEDQWKKDVTSTVKYVVSDGGATAPTDNVQNAQWTRTITLDKVTGQEISATPWVSDKSDYDAVSTPVLDGYYADKATVASKTVTQDNLTETVTYKPLGSLVPKSDDPNFPATPEVKYPNDPTDPTKPSKPIVPDVPGYKPFLPDPSDPTKPGDPLTPGQEIPNLPNDPGTDTPVIYVPIVDDVTRPTKQTVTFEGAGSNTPADDVQNDFTFEGKYNQADKSTTWNETSHEYGKVNVPVVPGYYADKSEAGGKTVTPDQPEATDKVTYKELGKLVPKSDDPNFPTTPEVKYPNDPTDPTKPSKPIVPDVPGYKPFLPDPSDPTKPGDPLTPGQEIPNLPNDPGTDTPVIYVPIVDDVTRPTKQTVTFEGAGSNTPADDVQNDFTFEGKYNQADKSTTWNETSHEYGKVNVPVVPGYYADKSEAGGKTVTPDQPEATDKVTYKELGKLVPKSDDPNFPTTPEVKYPNDPTDPTKPSKPIVPDVPGYKPFLPDPSDPTKPGDPLTPGQEIPNLPNDPGTDTPVIYVPIVDDVTRPTKQTVTFEGAGSNTPADDVQNDFTFTGKYNQADKSTTWNETSHEYGKVNVPVVPGYYADKSEAGGKTVTPDQPEATDKVTYKELGKIIPVDPDGNPIPNVPTPTYNNDPKDPTKGGETPVPEIPGYRPEKPSVTPEDPGKDTPVIYVKEDQKATVTYIDETTGQTLVVDSLTGKSGEAVGYSTAERIKYYTDRGYELVSDGYPADAMYDLDASVDQAWTVTLKHGTAPVGPNDPHDPGTPINPHDPGTPINPNDPDGPKWPAKDAYEKDVTSTVKYVGAGDKTPADNVQTAQWTRTLTIDKVTGEQISATDWASNKENYDAVATPVVPGYYADKASVASKTVTMENLEEVVTYKPLGSLVPKSDDPKFPDTPTVPYPNDPTDPTKPGQPVVPDVPGYKPYLPDPNDPTKPGQPIEPGTPITPENPGEDTPIIYVPITPDKPEDPKKPVTPVTPVVPVTPEQPAEPAKPEKPAEPAKPEVPAQPAEPEAPAPQAAPVQEQAVLPQTGSEDSAVASATGLGVLLAGLGLGFLGRRRKKED